MADLFHQEGAPARTTSACSYYNPPGGADLPFLPGNTFRDPRRSYFGRKEILTSTKPERNRPLALDTTSAEVKAHGWDTQPKIPVISGGRDTAMSIPPDMQEEMASFFAYVTETVEEHMGGEGFRVRFFKFICFLEDETLQVVEKSVKNSGLQQGIVVRRHRVPKPDDSEHYTFLDFEIGANVQIYGRVYHIYDCNNAARELLEGSGVDVCEAEAPPTDDYTSKRDAEAERIQKPLIPGYKTDEFKRFSEGLLGFPSHLLEGDTLKQFLDNDGKVLKLYCTWDHREKMFGNLRYLALYYFLADDTIQVVELLPKAAAGRGSFSTFVKRGRVPKKFAGLSSLSRNLPKSEFLGPEDLKIGNVIDIYGRRILINDCDNYTRNYLEVHCGFDDMQPIYPEDKDPLEEREKMKMPIPPHNNIGREEDSIGNVKRLVPKPPRTDTVKYMANDGKILRFSMKMDTEDPDDKERDFVLLFFLADDTVSVVEARQRNSGRASGTFLKRMKPKNPDTGEYFHHSDFALGSKVSFFGHRFIVLNPDKFSEMWLSGHEPLRVHGSVEELLEIVKKKFYEMKGNLRTSFRQIDTDKNGHIALSEFESFLKRYDISVTDAQLIGLLRKFDLNADGLIDYNEFMEAASDTSVGGRLVVADEPDDEYAMKVVAADVRQERLNLFDRVVRTMRSTVFHKRHLFTEALYTEFDKNRDGFIDRDEFIWALGHMGIVLTEEDQASLVDMIFIEKDGTPLFHLNYHDFLEHLNYYEAELDKPNSVHYSAHPGLVGPSGRSLTPAGLAESRDQSRPMLFPGASPTKGAYSRLSAYSTNK